MFMVNRYLDVLSPLELAQMQDSVEQFEAAWQNGQRPAIGDYLPAPGALRRALLVELVHADLEWRRNAGLAISIGTYLATFPDLDEDTLELKYLPRHCGELPGTAPATANCKCGACQTAGLRDPAHDCSTPTGLARMGRFEILEVLGNGAFATVYKARDTRLERYVALKVLRHSALVSAVERDRFLRESKSAARVHHPHIVAIHDAGEFEGTCYLVTELIAGKTLAGRLKSGPLSVRQAAEIAACVAETLHYAHQRGVIHRDIKPSNILIDQAGQPHVTDFGLAKWEGAESSLTQAGDLVGTPAYMPPEQARGEGHRVDARSDVYSTGAVLYEMLTGNAPFLGTTRIVLAQVFDEFPRPPRRLNDQVPRDLENICLKALSKEPNGRYATAAAFAEDLRAFLSGRPVRARPIGVAGRLGRWCRRKPATAALMVALLLAVASGFSTVTWQWQRVESHLIEAQTQRERADRQRASAEHSFALAHQVVGELANLRDNRLLRYGQGVEPLQTDLARKVALYYEDFIKQRGADRALRHQVAKAYLQLAFSYRMESGVSDRVIEALEMAASIYEQLIYENPEALAYRRDQAETYVALGQYMRQRGDAARARVFLGLAAERLDALEAAPPDSSSDMLVAQNRRVLGEYYRETGDIARARDEHAKAVAIWEGLYRRSPNLDYLWPLAWDRAMLARAWDELGNSQEALSLSQDSASLTRQLIERYPQDQEYQAFLSTRYHVIGNIYSDLMKLDDAIVSYRESLTIREKLAHANPGNADHWSDTAGTCEGLGEVLEQACRHEEALAAYQAALANMKTFLTRTPMTSKHRLGLSARYRNVARVERKLGCIKESAAALLELEELWPDNQAELLRIAWELGRCALAGVEIDRPFAIKEFPERRRCLLLALEAFCDALAAIPRQTVPDGKR
jgi:tetratricopeptide (TPR) repeat protein/tRNA A-37 threonylcarbamoyl transferase component Bud32